MHPSVKAPGMPANVPVAIMTPVQVPGEHDVSVRNPLETCVLSLVIQLVVFGSPVQETTVVRWYSVYGTIIVSVA
jgi:hypothetical protein